LAHTASINDLQSDTNASNSIGKILILDQLDLKNTSQNIQQQYQFLNYLKEESKRNKNSIDINMSLNKINIDDKFVSQIIVLESPRPSSLSPVDHLQDDCSLSECSSKNQNNRPTTSSAALMSKKQNVNLIVAFINSHKIDKSHVDNDNNE
jgi:hypothetical protein